jgi:ComF family protein
MPLRDFIHLFFPNYCLACHGSLVAGEQSICTRCLRHLPKTRNFQHSNNEVARKFMGKIRFHTAISFLRFHKASRVQRLMHELKYNNHPEIGYILGKMYASDISKNANEVDFQLVVPVPLHPAKQKRRGYNQSDGFAQGLAEGWGIDWFPDVLERRVFSETQTKKNRLQRWENVEDIFHVKRKEEIQGKHVLLVDDVVTTGATMEACGHSLWKAGAGQLSIAAIATATKF